MNIKQFALLLVAVCTLSLTSAQSNIILSKETTFINGKKYYVHNVEKGQTIFSIARAYNVKYQEAVYDGDIDKVSVGDNVYLPVNETLPSPEYKYYVIKQGNTLYSLAKDFNVTVEEIQQLNPRLQESALKIGEVIKMPVAKTKPAEKQKVEPKAEPIEEPKPAVTENKPTEQKVTPVAGAKKSTTETKPAEKQKTQVKSEPKAKTESVNAENEELKAKVAELEAKVAELEAQKNKPAEKPKAQYEPIKKQKNEPVEKNTGRNATSPQASQTQTQTTNSETASATKVEKKGGEKPKLYPEPHANLVNTNETAVNKNQTSGKTIKVSLLIPLYLDKIDEISTSKFDLEQRRKRNYKSFDFIQFYEGILLGLKSLEACGINVNLTVADIPGDLPDKVAQAFSEYNMAESDFIIALLEKKAFETAADLAKQSNTFIINPLSSRSEITENNPYVVKIAPSQESIVQNMLAMISKNYKDPNVFIVHSNSKNEKSWLNAFQTQLQAQNSIKYTIFDWNANSKLPGMLKNDNNNIVINIYDQDRNKNKTQSSLILNKLFSVKKNPPVLITTANWIDKYEDIDYSQLQRLSYHIYSQSYLDYSNAKHKLFIDKFKEEFKTEPMNNYAAIGNDIIVYFVTGVHKNGDNFWKNPNLPAQSTMLYHYSLKRNNENSGFENQIINFYKLNSNYKLVPIK